ncbi:uncharacterized protein [Palaemon carinicauda]|uniref:uncharacterized protein n=1 Tax=Palaemon carinicauda TaxID=392227 RepID=UPI0035B63369
MSISMLRNRALTIGEEHTDKRTALSAEVEDKLKSALLEMEEMGFGPTMTEFIGIVHDHVVANEIPTPFVGGRPGYKWAASFLSRHNLRLKRGGTMQLARKNVTADPFVIYGYYDLLQRAQERLGINGTTLPPVVVFRGKHMQSTWKGTQDIPGTQYAVSENGWMTTPIFEDILKYFVDETKDRRPLLLILDGHISHTSIATVELAKKENISILKLPAHCTDVLQPLDATCFAPLKNYNQYSLNDHVNKTGA